MSYQKRNKEYWKNYRRNRRALAKAKKLIKANGDSFVGEDEPIRNPRMFTMDDVSAIITYELCLKKPLVNSRGELI